jgi:esterase/lipase superfamily enzyme
MLAVIAFLLAGCAAGKNHVFIAQNGDPSAIAATHTIHIATTRQKVSPQEGLFGRGRAPERTYASVDVTIPRIHKTGVIEQPRGGSRDPAKHFAASRIALLGEDAFVREVREDMLERGDRVLVFVHGYNVGFDDGVYRLAQIVHDSKYSGTSVLFSWASANKALDYIYDKDSSTVARDALEKTLRLVARSGAKRIDIVAHSMGSWLLMEALRQLAITGDRDLGGKLGDVVLASPDIDIDIFRSQMARYGKPNRPFFVLLSGDDQALRLSGLIAGRSPRVGDYKNPAELAELGLIVVNLSNLKAGDQFNHAKFADNPLMVRLLGERLREDDQLGSDSSNLSDRVGRVATGLGTVFGSVAEIVVTTPFEVLNIAVGN